MTAVLSKQWLLPGPGGHCGSREMCQGVPSGGVSCGHIVLPAAVFAEGEHPGANTAPFHTCYLAGLALPFRDPLFRNNACRIQGRTCLTDGRILASLLECYIIAQVRSQHRGCMNIKISINNNTQGCPESRVPTKTPVRCLEELFVTPNLQKVIHRPAPWCAPDCSVWRTWHLNKLKRSLGAALAPGFSSGSSTGLSCHWAGILPWMGPHTTVRTQHR